MSDLDSIRACIGKIHITRELTELLWKDLNSEISSTSLMKPRVLRLVTQYHEILKWTNNSFPEISIQMPSLLIPRKFSMSYYGSAIPYLQDIIIGCQTAERGLEAKLKPIVEPELTDRLDSIRKEITKHEEKGLELNLGKNLHAAIDEAEQGHFLASAMISSRSIAYISDKIVGRNDEEKVQYLIDHGVVKKDRKDEQKQIMSSMRLSRNFLAHRIDLFSDSGNVLILLGGAISLSKILLSLKSM